MEKIEDKEIKKMYLDKLKEKLKENNTTEETQDYNLIEIFKRFNKDTKPVTISELQEEIKTVKAENSYYQTKNKYLRKRKRKRN